MSDFGLTSANLLSALPDALKNDTAMIALGEVISEELANRMDEIDSLAIYANIEAMPADLLDILAVDFKVDWWDADYSEDEKRQTLKDSWAVHRTLGTKGAVETAISAIYPDTKVSEWFEYNGEPFHFKLLIDASYQNVSTDVHQRVLSRVGFYKNLRSVLDGVVYSNVPDGTCQMFGTVALAGLSMEMSKEVTA